MRSRMPLSSATKNVLVVDDNDGDVSLVRASAEDFPTITIAHLPNAALANRYLVKGSPFEDCPTPDLVLLDLRMPMLDGSVVLQCMRESVEHRDTPVVVLTTSSRDRERCRQLGANEYVIKPTEWHAWQSTIRSVFRRFLSSADS